MKRLDLYLQKLRMRRVRPYVSAASRLLDIGCSDGALLRQLGPFALYLGFDPEAPVTAPQERVSFVRGVFPDVEVPGAAFDVVTALAVLEHVPPTDQARFAQMCHHALTPCGWLVITVPSPLVDPILDLLMKVRLVDGMETEQHYGFEPRETLDLFLNAGFELVKHERFELGLNHLFVFRRP